MEVVAAVWRSPTGRVGLILAVLLVCGALLAPLLPLWPPNRIDVAARLSPPSAVHWLGTDHLGRDLLSRCLFGARVALGLSLTVTGLAMVVGTVIGVGMAYAPRWAERAGLVVFDLIGAYPTVILALALVAIFGPGVNNLLVLITLVFVPQFGRIARAQTMSLRHRPFLEAEITLGASPARILFHHVLPNVLGPVIVLASMNIPFVITLEAGLSFLGFGIRPPLASWGSTLYDGFIYLDQSAWPAVTAGVALSLATLAFTLLGESLQGYLDPLRRSRA